MYKKVTYTKDGRTKLVGTKLTLDEAANLAASVRKRHGNASIEPDDDPVDLPREESKLPQQPDGQQWTKDDMMAAVLVPRHEFDVLHEAARRYSDDLQDGLNEGVYQDGEEFIPILNKALAVPTRSPEIYIRISGGEIESIAANGMMDVNVFDKDSYDAHPENFDTTPDEWEEAIQADKDKNNLLGVY